jgi:acyl carrier protein
MKPTQPEILAYVLKTVQNLCQDWDYADPVSPESLLFTGLGMESLDAVVLCTAMQEHYQTTMPFAELLADIGQKQRDLSIAELAEFVGQHVSAGAQVEQPDQQAVEAGPR